MRYASCIRTLIAALMSLAAAQTPAAGVSITAPLDGTVVHPGQTVTVKATVDPGLTVSELILMFASGPVSATASSNFTAAVRGASRAAAACGIDSSKAKR